jgi:hypothetical protein
MIDVLEEKEKENPLKPKEEVFYPDEPEEENKREEGFNPEVIENFENFLEIELPHFRFKGISKTKTMEELYSLSLNAFNEFILKNNKKREMGYTG